MSLFHNAAGASEDRLPAALLMIEALSHRALNDYTSTISMLRLAADEAGDSGARTALIDAAQSMHQRAQTFRALSAPQGHGPLDLADYLETVCNVLSTSRLASAGIRLTLTRESVRLPADRCWCLGLAVTELIMNAERHGLGWDEGDIRVEMSVSDIEVCCAVTNSGCAVAFPRVGRGHRIITGLVAGIGGRADWSFGLGGVCAALRIPRTSRSTPDFASQVKGELSFCHFSQ